MRLSTYYGFDPETMSFIDIDMEQDTQIFIDPFLIQRLKWDLWKDLRVLLKTFRESWTVYHLKSWNFEKLTQNRSFVHEINRVHLWYSKKNRWWWLSDKKAFSVEEIIRLLKHTSGYIPKNIQEAIMLTPWIWPDWLSDVICNVCKKALINFTEKFCLENPTIKSKKYDLWYAWDASTCEREKVSGICPINFEKWTPILLIPKTIVSNMRYFSMNSLYSHWLLVSLQDWNIQEDTSLVVKLKDWTKKVHKKELRKIVKCCYDEIFERIQWDASIFANYREWIKSKVEKSLNEQWIEVSSLYYKNDYEDKSIETLHSLWEHTFKINIEN